MPPLNLYARARHYHFIARETAGAARTRHSLHPPIFEGEPCQDLGRIAPREREGLSFMKLNACMGNGSLILAGELAVTIPKKIQHNQQHRSM